MTLFCHNYGIILGNHPDAVLVSYKYMVVLLDHRLKLYPHLLPHWDLMTPYGTVEFGYRWFRHWFVACSAPSHCLNQCWLNSHTRRNIFQWNCVRDSNIFIPEIRLCAIELCLLGQNKSNPMIPVFLVSGSLRVWSWCHATAIWILIQYKDVILSV